MPITSIRILPPMAIARFGSSLTPLEAFDLVVQDNDKLDYRQIVPQNTLVVDNATGEIQKMYLPQNIRFRDGDTIRPVAPFLEVFAQTSDDVLEPLTLQLLADNGLDLGAVQWSVIVGNLKVFRRTGKPDDKVIASVTGIADHVPHPLLGTAGNFLAGKSIPFGSVRFIQPTVAFPEIRLRFTPANGLVYGASLTRKDQVTFQDTVDPVFAGHADRIVYDATKGTWLGFRDTQNDPKLTNPSDIYQGYYPDPALNAVSWGYLDDVCDGCVTVTLDLGNKNVQTATAWISACMPAFAPDSQPMRTVGDELEQLILGPDINIDDPVSVDDAAEIVRRALETIRLINTRVMNGNTIDGRSNVAHTLVTQDSYDFGRQFEPIVASSLVDNFAVRALHERIFTALKSGTAPWFADVLRRPEEIGDMSDKARRKMPAMMRGPDGRALALTRRQIAKVVRAATAGIFTSNGKAS